MMAALIRNLRRAGLAHEAARVLTQKIEMERAAGNDERTRSRVSDLSLELSLLKLDDLNDAKGARAEVEAALAAAPNSPAALAAMARLYLKENDFPGYAEARIREAKALAGKPEAVAALLDAGRVFREQIGAPDKAQICFEEALREDPRNADALRSLSALLASQGAWEEAKTVLQRQLEISETPETRAAVLTDLGRAAWEGSADAAAAQRYLDEALSLVPDHIPAVIAIADIYYKENLWEQAERRLSEAVRKLRGQPQQMVRLYQRLAEVHEKLGKLEEAYRQLLEADRMGPGQLVTKLSLGENRFRAGKWREAALHLAGLADHPDAAIYPDEVADALAHGAQSEIKLRRPERAIALYEAALRLRNGHGPSLRALADLALERGEKPQAAIYLRRMAEASSDRAQRADLLRAGGRPLLRARRLDAGAGRVRRGAEDHRHAVGEPRAAAGEGAEAAARGRTRRGGGAHVVAADRSGQGSEGARGAPPRGRGAAGEARRDRRGRAPPAAGAGRAAAGRGSARRPVRRLAGAGQGSRAREGAAQDAADAARGRREQAKRSRRARGSGSAWASCRPSAIRPRR